MNPKILSATLEQQSILPAGNEERFGGYGIMGLPFTSGHILAFRRYPASSVGLAYSSVWHRNPAGQWRLYADTDPRFSCERYFGKSFSHSVLAPIDLEWKGPRQLRIAVQEAGLVWEMELASSSLTKTLNFIGRHLPRRVWENTLLSGLAGIFAQYTFGLGQVRLSGSVPNGQHFVAAPKQVWLVRKSTAWLNGMELRPADPPRRQARLGDFYIPEKGLFVFGQLSFRSAGVSRPISAADSKPPGSLSAMPR